MILSSIDVRQRQSALGRDFVADIKLRDLVTAHRAGIGDVGGDFGLALRADRIGRRVDVRIFECDVAESPAEREERKRAAVQVFTFAGRLLVVVDGKLADGARNRDGQLCAGIVVTEEDLREFAELLAILEQRQASGALPLGYISLD